MRLCAEETTPIVGAVAMAQLTQACRFMATGAVQRQLIAEQLWKVTQEV